MKLMLLNIPTVPGDRKALRPIGRNSGAFHAMLQEIETLVIRADQLGFAAYATAEHHFHTEGWEVMSAPLLVYAKLAALTKQIKFIPMSLVPVATNPLRIAEETAMFDQLFPGRIEVGLARGYQNRWMQVMAQHDNVTSGFPESDARNREIYDEGLQLIKTAWKEDCFSFKGKHYQVPFPYEGIKNWPPHQTSALHGAPGEIAEDGSVVKIGVVPPLYEKSVLPIWQPFALSPATLTNAAKHGHNMVINASEPDTLVNFCRRYQEESALHGRELQLGDGICALRDIVIGGSKDEAFDIAVRGSGSFFFEYAQHFGFMENWRIPSDDTTVRPLKFKTVEELTQRMIDQRWIIAGTLDDVGEQVSALKNLYGSGGSLEYLAWNMCAQGTLSTEESMKQLELVGTHILPAVA